MDMKYFSIGICFVTTLISVEVDSKRWQQTGFSPCSASCGTATRRSVVHCMNGNIEVSAHKCSTQPKPSPTWQICPYIPCPTSQWRVSSWSQCSVTCGSGEQKRRVWCEGTIKCQGRSPTEVTPCYQPACPALYNTYVQLTPKKKLTLVTSGRAVVIHGTEVTLHCGASSNGTNSTNNTVRWLKNGRRIKNKKRLREKMGYLKIRRTRDKDKGVYSCVSSRGQTISNITLSMQNEDVAREHLEQAKLQQLRRLDKKMEKYKLLEAKKSFSVGLKSNSLQGDRQSVATIYAFIASGWSECVDYCSSGGHQARNITCQSLHGDFLTIADDSLCEGQRRPEDSRSCGVEDCGEWETSIWSQCSPDVCVRNWVGQRRRQVKCFKDGSPVDDATCDPRKRPEDSRECRNQECIAMWDTSQWTRCSLSCGDEPGFQSRMLRCVWKHGHRPAGVHCSGIMRPQVFTACQPPTCEGGACRDRSRHCDRVTQLNLCHLDSYKENCCRSCRLHALHRRNSSS